MVEPAGVGRCDIVQVVKAMANVIKASAIGVQAAVGSLAMIAKPRQKVVAQGRFVRGVWKSSAQRLLARFRSNATILFLNKWDHL